MDALSYGHSCSHWFAPRLEGIVKSRCLADVSVSIRAQTLEDVYLDIVRMHAGRWALEHQN